MSNDKLRKLHSLRNSLTKFRPSCLPLDDTSCIKSAHLRGFDNPCDAGLKISLSRKWSISRHTEILRVARVCELPTWIFAIQASSVEPFNSSVQPIGTPISHSTNLGFNLFSPDAPGRAGASQGSCSMMSGHLPSFGPGAKIPSEPQSSLVDPCASCPPPVINACSALFAPLASLAAGVGHA